jgi:hypothetical protein
MKIEYDYVSSSPDDPVFPSMDYFVVRDHGVFIGYLVDDYEVGPPIGRPGWYFYRDGDRHHYKGNQNIWFLCDSGEDKENLAKWKFRRRYYAAVGQNRIHVAGE